MTYLVIFSILACGLLPMSCSVTFVKYEYKDLPMGYSDHVVHHLSVPCTCFSIIVYFVASMVPRVAHPGRSLVTHTGNIVQYKYEICLHS